MAEGAALILQVFAAAFFLCIHNNILAILQ
jgi:hypothetical protein